MKLVAHSGSRLWRGSEEILGVLGRGLRDRGHEVVLSVVAGSEVERRFREMGLRTSGTRPRGDVDVVSAWLFRRWLRREAPDALLLPDWRRLPWAAWAGKGAGVPRVAARVGLRRELPPRGLRRWAMLRWVDLWYVNAEETARALVRSAAELEDRVRVVPNGVPVDALALVEPWDLREELALPDGSFLALAAGTVAPRKGFDVLVRALASLGPEASDVHVAVAGDDARAAPVRALALRLGVADRVHFLGHRKDLHRIFAAADLFVLSSRNEGSPLVLLEAIAAGSPAVVATRVAGVETIMGAAGGSAAGWPEGVERLPTGWLVPPGDAAALARALRDAASLSRSDREAYLATGRAARERVSAHFHVDRMLDGVERLLFAGS